MKKKNMNEQIFREYFNYHSPSFLVKDLYEDEQNENDKIVKNLNKSLINLRNSINGKEVPKNENPNKIFDIVEKILGFNKQQKCKGRPGMPVSCPSNLARVAKVSDREVFDGKRIKILDHKQMLQRLPIALAQVKQVTHLKTY